MDGRFTRARASSGRRAPPEERDFEIPRSSMENAQKTLGKDGDGLFFAYGGDDATFAATNDNFRANRARRFSN